MSNMTPDEVLAVLRDAAAAGPSIHCTNQRTGEIHSHELHHARAAVAALIAERDALRETVGLFADDAQRLEFLIEKEVIPHKMDDTGLYMLVGADHYPYDGSEHDTPREAIDAARAEAGHG